MAAGVLTVPRLLLGEALKRLRAESGKTLDETVAVIGKSRARLINVLDGRGTLTAEELGWLLDHLGATPQRKRELLGLGVEARKRPPKRTYTDLLPEEYERIADLEAMATEIWSYERGVIPGLLQVPEYIEAIMADGDGIWWEPSYDERQNRTKFRLERQRLVLEADQAKALRFVMTDDALRTLVGSTAVMRKQLKHLLSLIDGHSNITVQVLESITSHNPSPNTGIIVLLLGDSRTPVGILPVSFGPSTFLDNSDVTKRLTSAFDKISKLAHAPGKSREIIADLLKGM